MTDPTEAVAVAPGATDDAAIAVAGAADGAMPAAVPPSSAPGVGAHKGSIDGGNAGGVSGGTAPSTTPLVPVEAVATASVSHVGGGAAGRGADPPGVLTEQAVADERVGREEGRALLDGGVIEADAAGSGTGAAAVDVDGPDGGTDGEGGQRVTATDASGGSGTGGDDDAVFPSFSELRGAVEDLDAGLDDAIGAAASSLWSLAATTAGRIGASAPPSTRSVVSGWSSHLPAVPTQETLVNFTSSVRGALAESPLPLGKVAWPGRGNAGDGAGGDRNGSAVDVGVGGDRGGEGLNGGAKGGDDAAAAADDSGGGEDGGGGGRPSVAAPDAEATELNRSSRAAVLASSGAVAVGELAPIYDVEASPGGDAGGGRDNGAWAAAPAVGDVAVTPAAVAAAAAGEISRVSQSLAGLSNTLGVRAAGLWGNIAAWVPADDEGEADDGDGAPSANAAPLTRFQQRVAAIQGDPSTYTSPPPGGDAAVSAWKAAEKWSLDDHEDEAVGVLDMFPSVAAVYEEKVPGEIAEEVFWARLFYRLSRLAADERRRVALLDGAGGGGKGVAGAGGQDGADDDELAWSDDEEEEETKGGEAGGTNDAPGTGARVTMTALAVEGGADPAAATDAATPASSGGGGGEVLATPSVSAAAAAGDSQPTPPVVASAAAASRTDALASVSAATASTAVDGSLPPPPPGVTAAPGGAVATALPPTDADDSRDGWENDDDDDWE